MIPNSGLVINMMDSNDGGGSHWVAMYMDGKSNVTYFDSYGASAPEEIRSLLRASDITTYKINATRLQGDKSTACGYYCLKFLDDMSDGMNHGNFLTQFDTDIEKNENIIQAYRASIG